MPYILKGRVNKPCEECGVVMEHVATTRRYCDNCYTGKHNRKRRKPIREEPKHRCATCDDFIPVSKTHCGRMNYRQSCAYKQAAMIRYSQNSKPESEEVEKGGKKRIDRNHLTDQACSSGFF